MKQSIIKLSLTVVASCLLSFNLAAQDAAYDFSSTVFETWTSTADSSIEARLVGVDKNGHYILRSRAGKEKAVPPEKLSESSQQYADMLIKQATKAEVADTEADSTSGEENYEDEGESAISSVSFFGTSVGGSSSSGSSSTYTPPPAVNHQYVGSVWQGKSPFNFSKGYDVKVTFKSGNEIHWSGSKEADMYYETVTEGHYVVPRGRHSLHMRFQDDGTLELKVGKNRRMKPQTFTKAS